MLLGFATRTKSGHDLIHIFWIKKMNPLGLFIQTKINYNMEKFGMFTKDDLYNALRQGDRSKVNFLAIVDDPEGGFRIKIIPKGETKYYPDKNQGPVVVCFSSFNSDENFIGPEAILNNETVDGFYSRLIYMYMYYRITGQRCFNEDYSPDLIKDIKKDLSVLNAEVEEGISCLMKEMNS